MESNLNKFQNTLTREGERETKMPDEMRGKTKRPDEGEGKEGTDFKNPPPSLSVVWRAWYLWTPHISNFQYPRNLGCKQTGPKKNKPHANWARQKRNSGEGKENVLPRRMPARACGVATAVGSFVGRRSSEPWPEWNPRNDRPFATSDYLSEKFNRWISLQKLRVCQFAWSIALSQARASVHLVALLNFGGTKTRSRSTLKERICSRSKQILGFLIA